MIPDDQARLFLSKAYIQAVATQAGFGCQFVEALEGVTARISEIQFLPDGRYVEAGYHFGAHLIAPPDFVRQASGVACTLEVETYNRLVSVKGGGSLLVVCGWPTAPAERLKLTETVLELRGGGYWLRLTGAPTEAKRGKIVRIPHKQVFDPEACTRLMEYVRSGEWPA